jgi:hypothetical protein
VTRPEEEANWLEQRAAADAPDELQGIPVRRAVVAADGSVAVR